MRGKGGGKKEGIKLCSQSWANTCIVDAGPRKGLTTEGGDGGIFFISTLSWHHGPSGVDGEELEGLQYQALLESTAKHQMLCR